MKNIIPTGEEVKIISYSKNYDTVVDLTPRSHTNLIRNREVVQLFATIRLITSEKKSGVIQTTASQMHHSYADNEQSVLNLLRGIFCPKSILQHKFSANLNQWFLSYGWFSLNFWHLLIETSSECWPYLVTTESHGAGWFQWNNWYDMCNTW